jgi:general secretion pathway protein D
MRFLGAWARLGALSIVAAGSIVASDWSAFAASTPQERAAIAAAIAEPSGDSPEVQAITQEINGVPQQHPQTQIYPATGNLLGRSAPKRPKADATDTGEITLNFINADVKDVAKAVLGDYLKLNYEIAANVQGPVTIQTSRPLPRSKVLAVLDQTLRLDGMAIVVSNNVYKVVNADDAARESSAINPVADMTNRVPGYGIEVVPIKYIGAAEMQKLLEPLAPSKAIVHVDAARNVLLIEGTEQERQTLLDDIALFDSDWLSGMSFALYTPSYMDSQQLTKELGDIMGGANSPIGGVVRLVPIDRLNAVLAISPQPRYLEQLKTWVARLDRPGQGTDKRIFVYDVQHGRATDLAATLVKTVLGPGSSEPAASQSMSGSALPPPPATSSMSPAAAPMSMAEESAPVGEHGFSSGASAGGLGGVRITPDETNNALVILATPQQYARIEDALRELDVRPLQVFLDAAIAEVSLNDKLQFGVQYFVNGGSNGQVTLSDNSAGTVAPNFPGFGYFLSMTNIKVALSALSAITHVEVLSSPQLMVLNNQTATLQVGDQVPILTQQAQSTTDSNAQLINTVQYQNTGVILKVTPRVNRSGEVMMDISQEVSDVSSQTSSGIQSPTIEERKIASSVAVQDGETVALGGLITRNTTETHSGIPFISEVPVVGALFRDTDHEQGKTELIVLITPHVIDNLQKARAITEELRRKLASLQPLLDDGH